MDAQILAHGGNTQILLLRNVLNELIPNGSEINLSGSNRDKYSNTFSGFEGEARGLPEFLKEPSTNKQAPQVFQGCSKGILERRNLKLACRRPYISPFSRLSLCDLMCCLLGVS